MGVARWGSRAEMIAGGLDRKGVQQDVALGCQVVIVQPGPRHADLLFQLFEAVGVAGNLTTDAYLAALAVEHQAELHSTDADFARFPGLRWRNPLARAKG